MISWLCAGDPNFKPYVSAEAEVRSVALQGDEELLIMASDGLLDFVTPQQAASAAFQQLRDNPGKSSQLYIHLYVCRIF